MRGKYGAYCQYTICVYIYLQGYMYIFTDLQYSQQQYREFMKVQFKHGEKKLVILYGICHVANLQQLQGYRDLLSSQGLQAWRSDPPVKSIEELEAMPSTEVCAIHSLYLECNVLFMYHKIKFAAICHGLLILPCLSTMKLLMTY